MMEVLSNFTTILEICCKDNILSFAVYKWRDEFIVGDAATMEHDRSAVEAPLTIGDQ